MRRPTAACIAALKQARERKRGRTPANICAVCGDEIGPDRAAHEASEWHIANDIDEGKLQ